jgi:hypothetical protein
MSIHIRRGEEQFGPYTPEEIATYLAEGNLLPTDLAWKAETGEWVPVAEILPNADSATSGQTAPTKKVSKKLIIGIAAGVVVVAALIVFFVVKPFGNADSNYGPTATPLPAPKPKGPTKTSFVEVTKHLDAGGPMYIYLSATQVQGWVQNLFGQGEQLIAAAEKEIGPRDAEEARVALKVGKAAYEGIGLDSIDGIGLSSFDLGNGINRNVAMVHHDPAKGDGLMWRMFGAKPHELGSLKLMPEETVFLVQGDLDLNALLAWAKDFVPKNAPPDVARDMASFLTEANQAMNMEKLIGSVDGELGIGITLDKQKMVNVNPGGASGLKIPEPGLIAFLKIKDSTLFDLLNKQISNLGDSGVQKQNMGDVTLYTMQIPQSPEIPVPLSPTLFQSGQYMVLTSTVDLAKKTLAVQEESELGLSGTEEFKRLGSGIELSGNHLFFTSDRVATVVGNTLDKVLEMEGDDLPEAVRDFIKNSATASFKGQLTVVKVLPEGYLVNNHTTGSGLESALLAAAVAPVGIMASMLLPALAKAKARANTIKSVNNAKQLTMGLMGYASDNRGQLPPPKQWCDAILRDVGTMRVFASPQDQQMTTRIKSGQRLSSYTLNYAVAGRNINSLNPATVLVFECPLGWNSVGTPQQLVQYLQSQTTVRNVAVSFADGSVRQCNLQMLQRLRWTP